jgi:hypothetical protein
MRYFKGGVVAALTLVGLSAWTPAATAFQDQWKPSPRSMAEYISDGFEIRETLLRHVSPFAKYEYVYFLRKERVVVRCIEGISTDKSRVADISLECRELVAPFDR